MKVQISRHEVEKIVLDFVRANMNQMFNHCEISTHRYGDDFCEVTIEPEPESKESTS